MNYLSNLKAKIHTILSHHYYKLTHIYKNKERVILGLVTLCVAGILLSFAGGQRAEASSNPLTGATLYVDQNSSAANQASAWRQSRPQDAASMDKIATQSQAVWFGNWNTTPSTDVARVLSVAATQNAVPILVAYNIPQRDCGGYSSGNTTAAQYKTWMQSFAAGIGNKKAVVILEPDALAAMDCLSQTDQQTRLGLLSSAVNTLKALGNTAVYIDAGHYGWIGASDMATRLKAAGINTADGFSLNVSNFYATAQNIEYGTAVSNQIGNKHFVIDTSRNGLGSNGEWCNPSSRALGTNPTTNTGNTLVDAYLWIKHPGESDGSCNGGPNAGVWWADYALGLAQQATSSTPLPSPTPSPTLISQTPAFTITASSTTLSTTVNQKIPAGGNITDTGGATSGAVVDLEIYSSTATKVFQQTWTAQSFGSQESRAYATAWTPTVTGTYTVKMGVFNNDWSKNYVWSDKVITIDVKSATTATTTTSTQSSTSSSTSTSVWWPTDGATVSGVQPFKAVVDTLDVSQYNMSWQVDGGAETQMYSSTDGYPHKEAMVDLSGWTWKGSGPYTVTFVARDPQNNLLGKKSVGITVK